MKMQIEILQNKKKKWFWRLKSHNGRILAHSEDYSSRKKAFTTVESIRHHFLSDEVKFILDGEVVNLLPIKA